VQFLAAVPETSVEVRDDEFDRHGPKSCLVESSGASGCWVIEIRVLRQGTWILRGGTVSAWRALVEHLRASASVVRFLLTVGRGTYVLGVWVAVVSAATAGASFVLLGGLVRSLLASGSARDAAMWWAVGLGVTWVVSAATSQALPPIQQVVEERVRYRSDRLLVESAAVTPLAAVESPEFQRRVSARAWSSCRSQRRCSGRDSLETGGA
jgi:hypothetical protein